jgi:hypothetical protein
MSNSVWEDRLLPLRAVLDTSLEHTAVLQRSFCRWHRRSQVPTEKGGRRRTRGSALARMQVIHFGGGGAALDTVRHLVHHEHEPKAERHQ